MSRKMRVLHVLDHSIPLQSGYTFRTRNILRQQRKLGWETCHVTGLKHHAGSALEEDVETLHFYRTPESGSLLAGLPVLNQLHVVNTLAKRLVEVVEREKPDILHAHSPALNGLAALRVAKKYGLPVVYECRAFWEDAAVDHGTSREWGLRYRLSRALETKVFRAANAVTTICEGLRGDIVARGIDEDKVTVIPNAVDIENFDAGLAADEELIDKLGLRGKTVLGFIGSFYAYEGIPLLLEALASMRESAPDIVLILVGGGPQEGDIRLAIESLGLGEAVVMTGRVPHETVQDYYNLIDVLVYPRLGMRLTHLVTPLKPLEAMAQGRLVVASDVGGHRELIEHGKTGYLFKADDVGDLADTIALLLARKDRWQEMRVAGRQFVERERSWEASASRYQSVYGALL
jgi:PEP-CTERM/exosortase A-associated glycosyltransferase